MALALVLFFAPMMNAVASSEFRMLERLAAKQQAQRSHGEQSNTVLGANCDAQERVPAGQATAAEVHNSRGNGNARSAQ